MSTMTNFVSVFLITHTCLKNTHYYTSGDDRAIFISTKELKLMVALFVLVEMLLILMIRVPVRKLDMCECGDIYIYNVY